MRASRLPLQQTDRPTAAAAGRAVYIFVCSADQLHGSSERVQPRREVAGVAAATGGDAGGRGAPQRVQLFCSK